jgi:hypothetical protein
MTSKMWRDYFAEFPDDDFKAEGAHGWEQLIADLEAMEALAIGGEGETHFYYKDAWEAIVAERDALRERCIRLLLLLRAAQPNRAMLDDDRIRSWYDSRDAALKEEATE